MEVADFKARDGVEDWRVLGTGLHARYRVGSLAEGARFAAELAEELASGDPVPDVDLRPASVTLRIPEHFADEAFMDERDVPLAQRIQALARERGLAPDPASLRSVQIAVASAPGVDVQPFWRAVLGHIAIGAEDAKDPEDRLPRTWFHDLENGRTGRGRTHVDVYVPAERAEAILADALAAGGRIVDDSHAPAWWTLASPDNHGVDLASWPDRD